MAGRCTLQKHPVFKWQWLGIYANCIVKPYGIVGRLNGDEAWQTSKEHTKMSTADNVLFYYMPYIIHVYYATKKFELFSWSDKSKYPICFVGIQGQKSEWKLFECIRNGARLHSCSLLLIIWSNTLVIQTLISPCLRVFIILCL